MAGTPDRSEHPDAPSAAHPQPSDEPSTAHPRPPLSPPESGTASLPDAPPADPDPADGPTAGLPLPGGAARTLYLGVLGEGGQLPMAAVAATDRPAVAELLELGLLRVDPLAAAYTVVNPRSVGGRLSEELRSAGTRLLVQAQEMPALLEDLTRAYDRTPRKVDRSGEVRHVHGFPEVRDQVDRLRDATNDELLSAQPGGALSPRLLDNAVARYHTLLERGGTVRTLYQPGARAHAPSAAFVLAATELGVRFRVLGESFKRILIFDRATVVIPSGADYDSAAVVEDPAVVSFLSGMFERDWARASPVQRTAAAAPEPGAQSIHTQVGRLLSQGLTQRMIAARLGLSDRTVAGHISRLRELYDAETLFQLGWLMRAANGDGRGE
jgi:hypothetical protein